MADRAYAFNGADFAFETFTDEIVVLNVTEGTYFAFGGSALEVWTALANCRPVDAIAAAVALRHHVATDVVEQDLAGFVEKLTAERILLPAQPTDEAMVLGDAATPANGFRPLSFERHADMEDLLTLDPIHDVDPQRGWPTY